MPGSGGVVNEQLEALLERLTRQFYDELPERFQLIERLIDELQDAPESEELFYELYRTVHSLKGAAGTYNAMIMTRICHHMENLLNECKAAPQQLAYEGVQEQLNQYLECLYLSYDKIRAGERSFAEIEKQLAQLDRVTHRKRAVALLIEPSGTLREICKDVLDGLAVDLTIAEDGYQALGLALHRHFDVIISGMRLPTLNAPAIALSLDIQYGERQRPLYIALSSRAEDLTAGFPGIDLVLGRDMHAFERLETTVTEALRRKVSR